MHLPVTCWTQDLQNRGGDFFCLRGEVVSVEDAPRAKEAVNVISRVTGDGRKHPGATVNAYVLGDELVADISIQERDTSGRNSRVAVHVVVPSDADESFVDRLVEDAVAFAAHAGRTLADGFAGELAEAVELAKKKKRRRVSTPGATGGTPWRLVYLLAFVVLGALSLALLVRSCQGGPAADGPSLKDRTGQNPGSSTPSEQKAPGEQR